MLKCPSIKTLFLSLFPILTWSRKYNVEKAAGDLIAGITIALTLIPQSMAYALLAGFAPQYGLYGSFMGGFVYAVMGTCPQINIGPAALLSLLTFTYTNGTNVDFAIFLCFVTGVVQVLAAIVRLGFLVEFVSVPVVSGFTSAAALIVASSQMKGLLGLKFKASNFINTWHQVFLNIGDTSWPDAALSAVCCIILVGMRALKNIPIKIPPDKAAQRKALVKAKTLWLLSVARNAVVVALATIFAAIVHVKVDEPLYVTGKIVSGLPNPQPPAFQTVVDDKNYSALDMLVYFGSGIIIVPLVGILTNVAIVKAFAKEKQMDATQEIIALGVCNIVCSFFQSIPINGSLSRSAVSEASGVRTPAAGICTGTLVILTLLLLTPYFYYIPRAALASVIVCAVLGMVDIATVKKIWKSSRLDLLPLVGCFFCCLALGIEMGLICGVVIDILLILFYNSRPPLDAKYVDDGTLPPHFAIHPVGTLHFAGAEKIRGKLLSLKRSGVDSAEVDNKAGTSNDTNNNTEASGISTTPPLVVHCDALHRVDYTFLQTLKLIVQDWCRSGRVVWSNAKPVLQTQLKNTLEDPIFCERPQLKAYLTGNVEDLQNTKSSEPGPSG